MKTTVISITLLLLLLAAPVLAGAFEKDLLHTSAGDVEVTFIGHASLLISFNGKIIHVDPFSKLADYSRLPKADLILLTHQHRDHLDQKALKQIRIDNSEVVLTAICASEISGGKVMKNGDKLTIMGIGIEAVPAYNLVHKRENGQFFHPKGDGNGYVLTIGDQKLYIGGDTENIPEMKDLRDIDYAFLPMNLPYTMTPEMVAAAARSFRPKVLYPYHYGDTDTDRISELLKDDRDIEVRIRAME